MVSIDAAAVEEYNAFGPWVARVSRPEELPPLYAKYQIDFAESTVLKFPRRESRRDLAPGMNLYDHVVVLTGDRMTVLTCEDDQVSEQSFPLDRIVAVSAGANLLDGELSVELIDGRSFSVPYNGSSADVIAGFVDTVRDVVAAPVMTQLRLRALARPSLSMGMDDLGRDDAVFTGIANQLASDPFTRVLSASGRVRLTPRGTGLTRLSHRLRPATLQGSVLASTDAELILFSRVGWITRLASPEISLKRTVIFRSRVDSIDRHEHPSYDQVSVFAVVSGRSRTEVLLPPGQLELA